jgi:hypothetical protein
MLKSIGLKDLPSKNLKNKSLNPNLAPFLLPV